MISVNKLIEKLKEYDLLENVEGNTNLSVNTVTNDSRRVRPNDVFVAISGEKSDGRLFIDKAEKNGAIAIVHEVTSDTTLSLNSDVTTVHVTNARRAEAVLADLVFGSPSKKLNMIGVTGTNGKTSTTYLTRSVLEKASIRTGLIGTIESTTGKRRYTSTQTTPGPLELHRYLAEMIEDDCKAVVMEVSSHAIAQDRTFAVDFDIAAFTNLTQDHLDYHTSFDEYFQTKKRLFDDLSTSSFAITNLNDTYALRMVEDTRASTLSFGTSPKSDIQYELRGQDFDGLVMTINGRQGKFNLLGEFNASNLACTYAIAIAAGLDEDVAFENLLLSERIPGRFESIGTADGRLVVVDYAHTPDALEKVLMAINTIKSASGKTWCVFGCGGDRDKLKRPLMGRAAEMLADVIVLTSDNPRTEDPHQIIHDIETGISENASSSGVEVLKIADRDLAIAYAALHSSPGDVILVAGKGSETYQVIGISTIDFDDRKKVLQHFPMPS